MVELGLIGYPLGHSFSPQYFERKFREEGVDGTYKLFPLSSLDELRSFLEENKNITGFNVTIPYKQAIISRLDEIDSAAKEIGAVNTVKVTRNGEQHILKGFNTDWLGFRRSLTEKWSKIGDTGIKALVLGTGGAAHAVAYALKTLGIAPTFVSRNAQRSELQPAIGYNEITQEVISDNLLIINTTPIEMSPNVDKAPEIPYKFLTQRHRCYDLIYNPQTTEFLRKSELQGASILNGLNMLHYQADAAWEIWTGSKKMDES